MGAFFTKTKCKIISRCELLRTHRIADPSSALPILQSSGIGCLTVMNYLAPYSNRFMKFASLQAAFSCQPVISSPWPN